MKRGGTQNLCLFLSFLSSGLIFGEIPSFICVIFYFLVISDLVAPQLLVFYIIFWP